MAEFRPHTVESAPEPSRPLLEATEKAWRMIPNLHAVLAESPAALEGYATLFSIFEKSSFSAVEKQVVYLVNNFENECRYCMAGHSVLAQMAGLDAASIEALREGAGLADPRLEALRRFTTVVVRQRGQISPADVEAFIAAGFTKAQVLEVILGSAVKFISNYTNHLAETPLDPFMKDTVWVPPSKRQAAI